MSSPVDLPDITAFYLTMRQLNPHLPPPEYVSGKEPFTIEMGLEMLPVMNVRIMVNLPDMVVDGRTYTVYPNQAHGHTHEPGTVEITEEEQAT